MTLQEILKKCADLVNPEHGEYINIIYGNAWEFQFVTPRTTLFEIVKTPQDDLISVATQFLLKIQEYKKTLEL